jgi:hypothetical protein
LILSFVKLKMARPLSYGRDSLLRRRQSVNRASGIEDGLDLSHRFDGERRPRDLGGLEEVSPPLHRLEVFTDLQRAAQQRMRKPIWDLYTDLELYRCHPGQSRRRTLRAL